MMPAFLLAYRCQPFQAHALLIFLSPRFISFLSFLRIFRLCSSIQCRWSRGRSRLVLVRGSVASAEPAPPLSSRRGPGPASHRPLLIPVRAVSECHQSESAAGAVTAR